MNYQLLHNFTFYAMYGVLGIAIVVVIERLIFYVVTLRHAKELEAVMTHEVHSLADLPEKLIRRDSVGARALREMLETKSRLMSRQDIEDLSEAIYIAMKAKLMSRIWILDTVVTAAPLLGLLGTIFGIIDTFSVLAQSGISDPSAVSKGIGLALFATALGIGIALFGLVFHNMFQEKVERINDHLKILLLRAGMGGAHEGEDSKRDNS
jgi:biopolymer transport protein ExbB